jgi:hypothetical protein
MPFIVDYPLVLADQTSAGLKSLYYNSGAFGFPNGVETTSIGWIGPADDTIRPAALPLVRTVSEPYPATLAKLLATVWQERLPGDIWIMPKAHWAYELDFGNKGWLPDVLRSIGVDPAILIPRSNGAAVAFKLDEVQPLVTLVEALLGQLTGSDFAAAWPGRRVACTIHSHQQLWWTTDDADLIADLDRRVPRQP